MASAWGKSWGKSWGNAWERLSGAVQPERPGDAAQAPTGGSASLSQSEFLKLNQLQTPAPQVVDKALVARRKRQRLEDDMLVMGIF
jgi:hypothetical protein